MQDAGVDLETPGLMKARTWRWLRTRIHGLLTKPPAPMIFPDGRCVYMPATRIGLQLRPPTQPEAPVEGG